MSKIGIQLTVFMFVSLLLFSLVAGIVLAP